MSQAAASGWAALFQTAFERSTNAMLLLQLDRTVVTVNAAGEAMLGYAPGELTGQRADIFVARNSDQRFGADWKTLLRVGRVTADRDWVRADGRRISVQLACQREPVTAGGLVLCVVIESHLRPLTHDCRAREVPDRLTPRELQVVSEIAMGRRAPEIAEHLFISTNTVRSHVRNAMEKVGARSQAQLVAVAMSHGLVDPHGLADPSR